MAVIFSNGKVAVSTDVTRCEDCQAESCALINFNTALEMILRDGGQKVNVDGLREKFGITKVTERGISSIDLETGVKAATYKCPKGDGTLRLQHGPAEALA